MSRMESILVGLISALVGGGVAFLLGYFFYYKSKLDKLNDDYKKLKEREASRRTEDAERHRQEIEVLQAKCQQDVELARTESLDSVLSSISSPLIQQVFRSKLAAVQALDVAMGAHETFRLWGEMFGGLDIVYLRTTSCIPLSVWEDEFMRKYEGEQRTAASELDRLRSQDQAKYRATVEVADRLIGERYPTLPREPHFERLFIVRTEDLVGADSFADLIERIVSQGSYMSVLVTHEGGLPMEDIKDFGIAFTRGGDIIQYELTIAGGLLYGGRVSVSEAKIDEAVDRYSRIRVLAAELKPANGGDGNGPTPLDVIDRVLEVAAKAGYPVEDRIVEEVKKRFVDRKCLACFLSTEIIMGTLFEEDCVRMGGSIAKLCSKLHEQYSHKSWTSFHPERRRWFEMIDAENRFVDRLIEGRRPRRVLEVGCGPGRFLALLSRKSGYEYDKIIGVDGDYVMYAAASARFPTTQYPGIEVYNLRVVRNVPPDWGRFDFCINAMNIVGWQDDEVSWLREMLRASSAVFFSLYKNDLEDSRKEMYITRGHRKAGLRVDRGKGVQLADCDTNPGVWSKSYSPEAVKRLCEDVKLALRPETDVVYGIDSETSDLLYLCVISEVDQDTEDERSNLSET